MTKNQSNMEKQITTVYVPTDEAPYLVVKDVEKEFIKARVTEQEAYLYTPEEHAAVQGYREALEKIEQLTRMNTRVKATDQMLINQIILKALSKAEDKGDNGWISVKDRLPEISGYYLAYDTNNGLPYTSTLRFGVNKKWSDIISADEFHPTHWQPLPPKP